MEVGIHRQSLEDTSPLAAAAARMNQDRTTEVGGIWDTLIGTKWQAIFMIS